VDAPLESVEALSDVVESRRSGGDGEGEFLLRFLYQVCKDDVEDLIEDSPELPPSAL
jgi:hypothetical protein